MTSIFSNKETPPLQKDLKKALGSTFSIWQALANYTRQCYPPAIEEWHFSGASFGWGFRIKEKKE